MSRNPGGALPQTEFWILDCYWQILSRDAMFMDKSSGFEITLGVLMLISAAFAFLFVALMHNTVMRLIRLAVSICTSDSSANDNCPACGSFRSSASLNGGLFSLRSTIQTCDDCGTKFTRPPSDRIAIASSVWGLVVIACAATTAYLLPPALSEADKSIARILIGVIAAYGGSIILERTVQYARSQTIDHSQ